MEFALYKKITKLDGYSKIRENKMNILKKILYKLIIIHIFDLFNVIIRILKPSKINNYIKRKLLIIMGAKIGQNLSTSQGVWIDFPQNIEIHDNVVLSRDVIITTSGSVEIGSNSMIGYGSKILSANHKIPGSKYESIRFSGHVFDKVVIEEDVWVGCNVVVLPGVTLKKGTIVAAGAVVTKDTEEYGIYGGVPAKFIKSR